MKITHNREFRGIWIPAEIWLENEINALEKILLVEINSLDNENGCIAGNDYFAGFLGITTIRVSQMIKKLKDEGYIYEASFDGRVRTLKSNIKTIVKQNKDDYKAGLKESLKQNEENVKPVLKEIINNSNTVNNQFNNPFSNINTANGFPSQSSYSEIPNSSVSVKNAHTEKQEISPLKQKDFEEFWKEFCNMCKAKGSTAGEKKPAEIEYQKAVKIAGHQGIMRTLEVFRDYILLAFENNKHACRWLKNINWQDFEEAINNYKQQVEILKSEARKQGKPLPIAQKTPEKQQEEVKMNEDAEKKRDSVIRHLNGEEMQFMKHIKEVLKTNFDAMHRDWIDDLVFSCRNKVAYFGFTKKRYIDIVQNRLEKFTQCVMREIATFEDLKAERIELKLID